MENWRDIPGYEGQYQASDFGRVRSLDRAVICGGAGQLAHVRHYKGRVLKPGYCRGYQLVNLNGVSKRVNVLVALTWLGPRPFAGAEVNHEDGDKDNNAPSNFTWMTGKENQNHQVDAGLNTRAVPVTNGHKTWPSIQRAARELGANAYGIALCIRGVRKTAGSHTWSRA